MQKTLCTLICDTRERNVLRHGKELENTTIEVKQITAGDYVIVTPTNTILAVIERKSLEDFAASLKDGRADNKSKLNALRSQTGCRIIYIIEGPEFPRPDDCFGNIPYRYIQSSIFHLIIRDGVSIIRTKDSLDTARTLAQFVISMDSLILKTEEPTKNTTIQVLTDPNAQPIPREDILSLLTHKHKKSDHEVVRELWSCFPGIGVESADEYIRYWTLADIVCGRVPRADIVNFKLASGRRAGKKVVASLTGLNKLIEVRLLSSVPGISHAMAVDLTNETPLARLLTYPVEAIAMRHVGKSRRNLGSERAAKILKYFNYKYTPTQSEVADISTTSLDDPAIMDLLSIL